MIKDFLIKSIDLMAYILYNFFTVLGLLLVTGTERGFIDCLINYSRISLFSLVNHAFVEKNKNKIKSFLGFHGRQNLFAPLEYGLYFRFYLQVRGFFKHNRHLQSPFSFYYFLIEKGEFKCVF